jgi:hypothetical protein
LSADDEEQDIKGAEPYDGKLENAWDRSADPYSREEDRRKKGRDYLALDFIAFW